MKGRRRGAPAPDQSDRLGLHTPARRALRLPGIRRIQWRCIQVLFHPDAAVPATTAHGQAELCRHFGAHRPYRLRSAGECRIPGARCR